MIMHPFDSMRRKVAYAFARAGEPPTKTELADALRGSAKVVIAVNDALTALSAPEHPAKLSLGTVSHLVTSKTFVKVAHDFTREKAGFLAGAISKAVTDGAPMLRRSWDESNRILHANVANTTDALMKALTNHALTSNCFGELHGASTLPVGLRQLIASALIPSAGCRKRTVKDAANVAEVRDARYHPDTPARACGWARGSLARRVGLQALNLDDVAFFLWWLAFAALTKICDDANATVVLAVLIKRAVYASEAVQPGLAQADAALRAMLQPHAENWYKPHGLRVSAAVMAEQVPNRLAYPPMASAHGARCALMTTFWMLFRSLRPHTVSTQHRQPTRTAPTHNHAHPTNPHAPEHALVWVRVGAWACAQVRSWPCHTCVAGNRHRRLLGHAR